jgi:glycosyltransferase involved in cell wall biosynthesis
VKVQRTILILLTSLRAEGTPRLVLGMCRVWRDQNIRPIVITLFSKPDELAPEYEMANIPVTCLDWADTGRRRYLRLINETWRICKRERVEALVSMPLGWHLFAAVGARLAGVRRVIAHVGNHPEPRRSRAWHAFRAEVQFARPFTTALVCCSDYVRERATVAFGLRPSETVTIPNGIAVEKWTVNGKRPPLHRECEIRIAMVGTLEAHKDQTTLIRAIRILQERRAFDGKAIRLVLVGEGSRRSELEMLVQSLGLTECVEMLGTCTNVCAVLDNADIFVFSTTEREGQGIALLEAMAAGLPIVASDVGACREVLAGGMCGVLFPPRDSEALASAIQRVLSDAELCQALREAAMRRVENVYHIRTTANGYAALCWLNETIDRWNRPL